LFIYIEKSIQQGTQWVVFEQNDPTTWARVVRSVSDFLTGLWMQDMLMGATKDQAFFVRCDNTTMTQADIENGRLIVLVGVAPVYPAEFVIFRIGQWSGGASVTES
jgi:phage tail sheath protein FI